MYRNSTIAPMVSNAKFVKWRTWLGKITGGSWLRNVAEKRVMIFQMEFKWKPCHVITWMHLAWITCFEKITLITILSFWRTFLSGFSYFDLNNRIALIKTVSLFEERHCTFYLKGWSCISMWDESYLRGLVVISHCKRGKFHVITIWEAFCTKDFQ